MTRATFSVVFRSTFVSTVAAFAILTLALAGTATADTFGSGGDSFNIDFVNIGNPGNTAATTDSTNPGAVDYSYRMGKFEISEDMIEKAKTLGGVGHYHKLAGCRQTGDVCELERGGPVRELA